MLQEEVLLLVVAVGEVPLIASTMVAVVPVVVVGVVILFAKLQAFVPVVPKKGVHWGRFVEKNSSVTRMFVLDFVVVESKQTEGRLACRVRWGR